MVPFVLFLISVLGMALTWHMPDLFLIALLAALASLVLLARSVFGRSGSGRAKAAPKWAVIDGSNVMYWRGGAAQLDTVQLVLSEIALKALYPRRDV
jgi:hypothetical protein